LVSGYAHVFILLSVVIVTLPLASSQTKYRPTVQADSSEKISLRCLFGRNSDLSLIPTVRQTKPITIVWRQLRRDRTQKHADNSRTARDDRRIRGYTWTVTTSVWCRA